jgi:hypothetical protein
MAGDPVVERENELPAGVEFSSTIITPDRGLALVNHGKVTKISRWHRADKDEFATKLTMGGMLPISPRYVESVRGSKPIGYWRFESAQEELFANEIDGAPELKQIGNLRLVGDASNHVVELGRPGADGILLSQGTVKLDGAKEYSTEVWVKPSHLHNGSVMILMSDLMSGQNNRAAFYLHLLGSRPESFAKRYPSRIRYLHRNPPSADSTTGTSIFSENPYTARRWQHVVTTKDQAKMRLYVDGALVASGNDPSPLANELSLLIGQGGVTHRVNPFIGQLDELAIYDRVLSPAEIHERLKTIDWKEPVSAKTKKNDF